jgi:DNA-directed RNA polymerase subunit omega
VDRIENLPSKFRFVHAASQRARQLQSGAQPLIQANSRKPTRIAMEEVLEDKVTYEVLPPVVPVPPVPEK